MKQKIRQIFGNFFSQNKYLWLFVFVSIISVFLGSLFVGEARAFVFGGGQKISQWLTEGSSVLRLRNESNTLRIGANGELYVDTGNGRVGIGTTNPSYKLDVAGNFNVAATSTFIGSVGIGTTNGSGKLGIGTTSPSYAIDIRGRAGGIRESVGNGIDDEPYIYIAGSYYYRNAIKLLSAGGLSIYSSGYGDSIGIQSSYNQNALVLTSQTNSGKDFSHGSQANPTLFIHSAISPVTDITQWLGLTHNQTNGVISTGKGSLILNSYSGNVGIGTISPTAVLHLKAGTAATSTAPLKFTSGINLATSEAGAMEFDGTNLYFTPSDTRKTIAFTDSFAGVFQPVNTTLTALAGLANSSGALTNDGNGNLTWSAGGGSMVWPEAGIPVSTGSGWGTSIADNHANWDTAYSWGNHADAGYLTSLNGALLADGTITGATSQAQTFTNGIISSTITGGADATSNLYLKTTSGNGTTTADMHFLVGNNGATEAMTILNNGYVGIGTTAPMNKLQIGVNSIGFNGNDFAVTNAYGGVAINTYSTYSYIHANRRLDLYGNGYAMTLNSGNVGIGTTAPSSLFQVVQATTAPGTVTTNGTATLTGNNTQFLNTFKAGDTITVSGETVRTIASIESNTSLTVSVAFSTSASGLAYTLTGGNRLAVLGNGNVGIGTTGPGAKLEVAMADSASAFRISRSSFGSFDFSMASGAVSGDTLDLRIIPNQASSGYLFTTNGGGTKALAIQNSGNVGIGTTNPIARLDIVGSGITSAAAALNVMNASSTSALYVRNDGNVGIGTTAPGTRLEVNNNGSGSGLMVNSGANAINQYSGIVIGWTGGSYSSEIRSTNTAGNPSYLNPRLGFFVQNTNTYLAADRIERLSILSSGNVGIGTTDPSVKLQVTGGAYVSSHIVTSGDFIFSSGPISVWKGGITPISGSNGLTFLYGVTEGMRLNSSGNVGIGTTNPIARLDIVGSGITSVTAALNVMNASSTSALYVRNDGNVGIGTTAPGAKLDVAGNIILSSLGSSDIISYINNSNQGNITWKYSGYDKFSAQIGTIGSGAYARKGLAFYTGNDADTTTNAQERMRITEDGKVGIGTTAPSEKLNLAEGFLRLDGITPAGALTATESADAGNPNGTYRYVVTFYTSTGETPYNATTGAITVSNKKIELTNIPISSNSSVVGRKIYRTTDGGYYYAARLLATIADNTTTTYTDDTADASLGSSSVPTMDTTTGFKYGASKFFKVGPSGVASTAVGIGALGNNSGGLNTAVGYMALNAVTSGYANTAVGHYALNKITTSAGNVAVGYYVLNNLTSGSSNSGIGYYALTNLTTGSSNFGMGSNALYNLSSGSYNAAIGVNSMIGLTTGSNNTAIGSYAGRYIADGTANQTSSNSMYFGYDTRALADGDANEIVIGYGATGIGSNTVTLGNNSIITTALKGSVGIGTTAPLTTLHLEHGAARANATGFRIKNSSSNFSWIIDTGIEGVDETTFSLRDVGHARYAMVVTNTGNVGIGTTNPGRILDVVSGSNDLSGGMRVLASDFGTNGGYLLLNKNSGSSYATIQSGDTGAYENLLLNPSGGNVGIGTTSPSYKLDVYQSATSTIAGRFQNGNGMSATLADSSAGSYAIKTVGAIALSGGADYWTTNGYGLGTFSGDLVFKPAQSEKMRITSAGNVGIGTTNPGAILDIRKDSISALGPSFILENRAGGIGAAANIDAMISTGASVQTRIGSVRTDRLASGDSDLFFSLMNNGALLERFRIQSDGKVGIGTTAPATTLHVVAPAASSTAEEIARFNVSDSTYGYLSIQNQSSNDIYFAPKIYGYYSGGGYYPLYFVGDAGTDNNTNPITVFNATYNSGTVTTRPLYEWQNNGSPKMTMNFAGNVGIGTTEPTAVLHLKAGTSATSTAPLKFTGGTNLEIPEAGAMEFDGANLYFTPSSSRKTIAFTDSFAGVFQPVNETLTALAGLANTPGALTNDGNGNLTWSAGGGSMVWPESGIPISTGSGWGTSITDNHANWDTAYSWGDHASAGYLKADGTVTGATSQAQTFTNGIVSGTITGGADATSNLYLKTTSGNGTTTADMHFLVGNNGATEAMTILNNGYVGIGRTAPQYDLDIDSGTGNDFLRLTKNSGGGTYFYANTSGFNFYAPIRLRNSTGVIINNFSVSGDSYITSGNVGIGTTAPGGLLDLQTGAMALRIGADTNRTTRTDVTDKFARVGMPHYLSAEEDFALLTSSSGFDASNNVINIGGGSVAMNAATKIKFFTAANYTTLGGTERMIINGSGNVGIGTTAPGQKLDVAGNMALTTGGYIYGDSTSPYVWLNNTNGAYLGYGSGSKIGIGSNAIRFWTNNSEIIRIDSAGNVGIGTTAPGAKLHIIGNAYPVLLAERTTTGTTGFNSAMELKTTTTGSAEDGFGGGLLFEMNDADTTGSNIIGRVGMVRDGADNKGAMVFLTRGGTGSDTEKMRIDNQGNVGIGTTNPAYTLDVNGTLRAQTSISTGFNTATLSGDVTLTPGTSKQYQYLDPNSASRNVTLETVGATAGDRFIIRNNGAYNVGNYLIILQSSTILDYIFAGGVKDFVFDGTNWVSASNGTGGNDNNKYNVGVGYNAKGYNYGTATGNNAIGYSYGTAVGNYAYGYSYGAAVGSNASGYISGAAVGSNAKGMRYGAAVGYQTGYNLDTSSSLYNNLFGAYAGYRLTTGAGNIIMGYQSGYDADYSPTTGSYNILIGHQAGTPATTTSNFLNIGNAIFATGINNSTFPAISNAKVGIGTTNPLATLHVNGTVYFQNSLYTTAIDSAFTGVDLALSTGNSKSIIFKTGGLSGTERMRIDSSGNVGIGTTAPGYALTVVGIINSSGSYRLAGSTALGSSGTTLNLGSSIYYTSINYGSASTTAHIFTAGNVGIGTTNPQNKLHIEGVNGGSAGIYLNDAAPATTTYALYNNAGTLSWNGAAVGDSSGHIVGNYGYIPKFTDSHAIGNSLIFETDGKVGIGTTDMAATFDIRGGLVAGSSGTEFIVSNAGDIIGGTFNGLSLGAQTTGFAISGGTSSKTLAIDNSLTLAGADGKTFDIGNHNLSFTTATTTELVLPSSGTVTALGNSVTGSGDIVLATSPTLVAPVLGVASATSLSTNSLLTASGDLTIDPFGNLVVKGSGTTSSTAALNVTDSGSNSLFYVRNDGNIGINTTAPGYKLEINANLAVKGGGGGGGGYYLGLFKNTGSRPGYPSDSFPTIKTDFSQLYFSINGSDSAYVTSGGVWTQTSSRSLKENFEDLDDQDILARISQLPMYKWNYISEDDSVKHIAPFAEDFHSLFGLNGSDSKVISTIDPSGVALVGIKAAAEKISSMELQLSTAGLIENASTSATSTDEIASPTDRFVRFVQKTLASLGVAIENGIASLKELTADKINSKQVNTDELCVDGICVTKEQFKELLIKNNIGDATQTLPSSPQTGQTSGTTQIPQTTETTNTDSIDSSSDKSDTTVSDDNLETTDNPGASDAVLSDEISSSDQQTIDDETSAKPAE